MAKQAHEYKVDFGYLAQDGYYYGPNGIVGLYHRGNDRPCPAWTPIVIGDTTIGYTGSTGLAGGAHLHTQAGTDLACQDTISPTPYDFKPGKVAATGKGTQWGNYITIKVGTKYITYAHLSKISVKTGATIKLVKKRTRTQLLADALKRSRANTAYYKRWSDFWKGRALSLRKVIDKLKGGK